LSKDVKTTLSEDQIRTLVQAAIKVKEHAYAPYSKFPVGAAVLSSNGQIYCGCNVENAAYPVGSCAEASAISAMVSAGQLQIDYADLCSRRHSGLSAIYVRRIATAILWAG